MNNGGDCSVRVVCRIRPLNDKEKETSSFVVNFPAESTVGLAVSGVGKTYGRKPCSLLLEGREKGRCH